MRLLSALAIIAITATAASHADDQKFVTAEKEKQARAALLYLQLVSDGEMKLDDHTAISKHCSPKRRSELETQIKRSRESRFKANDTLSIRPN